ncbi:hypothetical protein THAOC_08984, partial [Thalassiosira oceanica]
MYDPRVQIPTELRPGGPLEDRHPAGVDLTRPFSPASLPPADSTARPPDSLCGLRRVPKDTRSDRLIPRGKAAPQGPAGAPPEDIDDVRTAGSSHRKATDDGRPAGSSSGLALPSLS